MTREQIAEALGFNLNYINIAFELAKKEHPELDLYDVHSSHKKIDYTLDQVLLGMSYIRGGKGLSKLETTLIKEDFTMMEPEDNTAVAIGIEGTEEFLEKVKHFPKKRCCSTCSFCGKSTISNKKPILRPYCNLWDKFLYMMKADPYNDYCKQWEYSNKEPLIFYSTESPVNLDIYGNEKNEVMGYDVSNFGKSKSKDVKLVTDIGLEDVVLF